MKKITWFVLVAVLMLSLVPACAGEKRSWKGKVIKVIDGDSIVVQKGRKKYEVRLYGIDAPEYRQSYSRSAKRLLNEKAYRKNVVITPMDVDRYDRVVAIVEVNGQVVNRELVAAGYAWVYDRYCHKRSLCNRMRQEQVEARKARKGLWRGSNPEPPWEWKRRKH